MFCLALHTAVSAECSSDCWMSFTVLESGRSLLQNWKDFGAHLQPKWNYIQNKKFEFNSEKINFEIEGIKIFLFEKDNLKISLKFKIKCNFENQVWSLVEENLRGCHH